MPELAFHQDWVVLLFEHRTGALTALAQAATWLGDVEGYVLVVLAVLMVWDRSLALRLAVLVLLTMTANHLLKTWLANPRPFVADGTWMERWAVAPATAAELVAEFSTPSGHAMAGAAFYGYLFARAEPPWLRAAAVAALLATGASRPYLGVHYVEDVLLGWTVGAALAWIAVRRGDALARAWNALALRHRGALVVTASALLVLATRPLYEANAHGQPVLFVGYLGFLTGIVLGDPLEARWVGLDPRSGGPARKLARWALAVGLVLGTILVLDAAFARLAEETSLAGTGLRYLRYAAAALAGALAAPWLAVRMGMAAGAPSSARQPARPE